MTNGKITLNDIPNGCTHVYLADETSYNQTPFFMKWGLDFIGPESGNYYYHWYIWHHYKFHSGWIKDSSFANRFPEKLVKVEEYKQRLEITK